MIKILAVGKIKESYLKQALDEYVKRISRFFKVEVVEVEECTFGKEPSAGEKEKILQREGELLLDKAEGCIVALDIDGKELSSEQLAEHFQRFLQTNSTVTFVVGGSYGLSDEVKQSARLRLSFGKITLPHQLCRVVLCEQIYRAFSIINNLPYHK